MIKPIGYIFDGFNIDYIVFSDGSKLKNNKYVYAEKPYSEMKCSNAKYQYVEYANGVVFCYSEWHLMGNNSLRYICRANVNKQGDFFTTDKTSTISPELYARWEKYLKGEIPYV